MSFEATRWVWENSPHKNSTLLVQLALADFANEEGRAWPAAATLGEKVGLKKSAVWVALRVLQDTGQIEKVKAGGTRQQLTTIYRLPLLGSTQTTGVREGGHEPTERNRSRDDHLEDHSAGSCPPERTGLLEFLDPEFRDDVLALSRFFGQELVRLGRKRARYLEGDARSEEWLGQAYKVWSEHLTLRYELHESVEEFFFPVITEILECGAYDDVRHPSDLPWIFKRELFEIRERLGLPDSADRRPTQPAVQRQRQGTPKELQAYYADILGEPEDWNSISLDPSDTASGRDTEVDGE